jgi:hypothetical protein
MATKYTDEFRRDAVRMATTSSLERRRRGRVLAIQHKLETL